MTVRVEEALGRVFGTSAVSPVAVRGKFGLGLASFLWDAGVFWLSVGKYIYARRNFWSYLRFWYSRAKRFHAGPVNLIFRGGRGRG